MPFYRLDELREGKWIPQRKSWWKTLDTALIDAKRRTDRTGHDTRVVPISDEDFNEGIKSDMDWLDS